MVEERGNDRVRWGTWEELILGGAVLRHGSFHEACWDVVALELQARTLYPSLFTPQVCKAKYEELQERYSGSSAWFEELKKRRVDELRRALENSENSIGSLATKLESLKTHTVGAYNNEADYSSSKESPIFPKSEEVNEFSAKEASKDGLSAGSFTQETHQTLSQQCQSAATKVSVEETAETKTEPSRLEKFPSIEKLAETILSEQGVNIRRRRGQRRRKDLSKDVKEGSVGENNLPSGAERVTVLQGKENLASDCGPPTRLPDTNDQSPCTSKQESDDLMKILDSIMENEHASVFRRRLDSQKRARYKKIIRQHMDLDTIRSKITNCHITSLAELLRDLLLLATNTLVFYSKTTREYKCGLVLRDLVTKKLRQHRKAIFSKIKISVEIPISPVQKPPVKVRTARPFNSKNDTVAVKDESKSKTNVGSPSSAESSVLTKKSSGRRGKVGRVKRGNAGLQAETPMKVRKRTKVK